MRLRSATIVAIVLHAGASAALVLAPVRARIAPTELPVAAPSSAEITIDEEDEGAEPPSAPPQMTAGAELRDPPSARPMFAPAPKTTADALASLETTPTTDGTPAHVPTVDDGSTWTYRPTTRAFDATSRHLLGPGGAGAVTAPASNEAPPKPAGASTTGGVTEALDEHDLKLGISRGGEVLSAMENAARAGNGPLRGNATFDVVVDAAGNASVSIQNASDDYDGWAKLVGSMRDAVSKRHVRLAPGAKGHRITVRIESRIQYIDGRDPRKDGARLEGKGLKLTETKTQITIQLPSVTAGYIGKTCGAGLHVGLDGVSILGGCSPENAGIPPQRVVSGRIVGESRL